MGEIETEDTKVGGGENGIWQEIPMWLTSQ